MNIELICKALENLAQDLAFDGCEPEWDTVLDYEGDDEELLEIRRTLVDLKWEKYRLNKSIS